MAGPGNGPAIFLLRASGRGRKAASTAADGVVQMILGDFSAQSIAMNSKDLGGATLIALGVFQNAANKFFLEFRYGFLKQNATFNHHTDQRIQLLFHVCVLRSEAPSASFTN
jgi:hypothetical protein